MLSPILSILPQETMLKLKLDDSVTRKKAGWRSRTEAFTAFSSLFESIFCLDERKKCWYLHVFQKVEDRDVNETL